MKSTGIVRKIDELGRVVLPMEMRKSMGIKDGDAFEIYVEGEKIIFAKYTPFCLFCGSSEGMVEHCGKKVCRKCLEEMNAK